jgi:hypothetical protein
MPNRIKCITATGSKLYSWPINADEAHKAHISVAVAYARERGWLKDGDQLVYGGMPDQTGYCFNFVTDYSTINV